MDFQAAAAKSLLPPHILKFFCKGATMHRGVYTDFLCKALPMPTEGPSDISEAAALLSELHEQNICRMIFAPLYYPRRSPGDGSLGFFVRTRNRIFKELKPYLPQGIRYSLSAEIGMFPGCFEDPDIGRLRVENSEYLIVSLPFPVYTDELWKDMNHLVYHRKFKLLLSNFNRYLIAYPECEIKKLLKIPDLAFHFSIRSLDDRSTVKYVLSLLSAGKHVVFGTGARCRDRYDIEMEPHFKLMRRYLSPNDFEYLMFSIDNFCRPKSYLK